MEEDFEWFKFSSHCTTHFIPQDDPRIFELVLVVSKSHSTVRLFMLNVQVNVRKPIDIPCPSSTRTSMDKMHMPRLTCWFNTLKNHFCGGSTVALMIRSLSLPGKRYAIQNNGKKTSGLDSYSDKVNPAPLGNFSPLLHTLDTSLTLF